jgi:probable phosphoglycerate mutase
MTELIVIRHGETDWNRAHRFQGQIDVPLNAMGLEQAERLAHRLRDEPFDTLLCSDLQRAQATAETLARARRHAPTLAPLPEALWREQRFGALEGQVVAAVRDEQPTLWAQWLRHDADFELPGGGESNRQFHARVMQALQALLARHAGQRVVVVSHGGVLDMLWRSAHRLSLSGPRECEIPNTGINRLRWQDGALQITGWAEAEHLAGLPPQPSTAQTRHPEEP